MATVATAEAVQPHSSADGVAWDLSDLYRAVDDPKINEDLAEAMSRAQAFEASYRGKIDVPAGPAAADLRRAMEELESLSEQMDRPAVYAHLLHASRTDEPRYGALVARTTEQRTA